MERCVPSEVEVRFFHSKCIGQCYPVELVESSLALKCNRGGRLTFGGHAVLASRPLFMKEHGTNSIGYRLARLGLELVVPVPVATKSRSLLLKADLHDPRFGSTLFPFSWNRLGGVKLAPLLPPDIARLEGLVVSREVVLRDRDGSVVFFRDNGAGRILEEDHDLNALQGAIAFVPDLEGDSRNPSIKNGVHVPRLEVIELKILVYILSLHRWLGRLC